jgi:hypothetical protein
MKTLILLIALYLPCMAFSQTIPSHDTALGFGYIGFNHTDWEKIPAGVKTQFNSSGFYGGTMNEYYFNKTNPKWCIGLGVLAGYDVISSNAMLNTDASGKSILTIIPSGTNYITNTISIASGGIPVEVNYNIPLGKKGNSKFFVGAGYVIQYVTAVQTSYTTKGDTSIVVTYTNNKNMHLFTQEITGKAGFGFRGKKKHWFYVSLDGFYGLNSVFKSNDGPDLVPYSIGISIGLNLWGD